MATRKTATNTTATITSASTVVAFRRPRRAKLSPAEYKQRASSAQAMIGYDPHTSPIGGKQMLEVLDMLDAAIDAQDDVLAKQISNELRKRIAQRKLTFA